MDDSYLESAVQDELEDIDTYVELALASDDKQSWAEDDDLYFSNLDWEMHEWRKAVTAFFLSLLFRASVYHM